MLYMYVILISWEYDDVELSNIVSALHCFLTVICKIMSEFMQTSIISLVMCKCTRACN